MRGVLDGLSPEKVFRYFEEISRIPRGTGNEKGISDHLVAFARQQGLEVIQDKALNVIIRKPAAEGYEAIPAVILQGHMDMVCEKNKDTIHDFGKDPISLRVEGDMIYAGNTTLGADNGIAVAYIMSILSSRELCHPAIEAVITTGEEGSMTGAFGLAPEMLSGRLLINLDAEKEGRLIVSSSGGVTARLEIETKHDIVPADCKAWRISIGGLRGGHSGADINKGRGNAIKLMGRMLNGLDREVDFLLKSVDGGMKANAITREAEAVIFINSIDKSSLEENVQRWEQVFKREYTLSDPGVFVRLESIDTEDREVLSEDTKYKLISCIMLAPDGIQTMSMEVIGLVESSNNLGIVRTGKADIVLVNEIRSCEKSRKYHILEQFRCLAGVMGCGFVPSSDYPGWPYTPDSRLRKLFQRVYRERYGREAEIKAIHAGLECGILVERLDGLDAVSIGPDVFGAHTPEEHLSISSARNTYEYLLAVLEEAGKI